MLLMLAIDLNIKPVLCSKHYLSFPLSKTKINIERIKSLRQDVFWVIIFLVPFGALFDASLVLSYRIIYWLLIYVQFFFTLYLSLVVFDLLERINLERQFFLIPIIIIFIFNITYQSNLDLKALSLVPFGGFVFTPFFLAAEFSITYLLLIILDLILCCILVFRQAKLKPLS